MLAWWRRAIDACRRTAGLLWDVQASVDLLALGLPDLPRTSFSLRPSAIRWVLNEVALNRRTRLLELGAGLSTVYLAKAASIHGGQVVSVESDERWLGRVRGDLERADLADRVRLVHAPLAPLEGYPSPWYDRAALGEAAGEGGFDLLLVDGPEAGRERPLARLPALPELEPLLAPSCAVFLDDIHRSGERAVVRRWSRDGRWSFESSRLRAGMARAVRGAALSTAP